MELFDFLRFRWKLFTALMVLGIAAVLFLGQRSAGDVYFARTDLLIRPSNSELSSYGSNLDRYVTTEMTLLFTPESLAQVADEAGVDPQLLAGALSYTHADDSEVVTLELAGADREESIKVVNAVANAYLSSAEERAQAPVEEQSAYLQTTIARTRKQLAAANAVIMKNAAAYAAANPDDGIPSADTISPNAAADASLYTSRLQRYYQQRADIDLQLQDTGRSQVLNPAERARRTPGWSRVTYLAALAGVALFVLALAGAGLALSRRVLGRTRWDQATGETSVRRALDLERRTKKSSDRTARRVVAALRSVGAAEGQAILVYLPEKRPVLARHAAGLLKSVDDRGVAIKELDSLDEISANRPLGDDDARHLSVAPVLLVVDTQRCRIDEATHLRDFPEGVQRRIVPVLA